MLPWVFCFLASRAMVSRVLSGVIPNSLSSVRVSGDTCIPEEFEYINSKCERSFEWEIRIHFKYPGEVSTDWDKSQVVGKEAAAGSGVLEAYLPGVGGPGGA